MPKMKNPKPKLPIPSALDQEIAALGTRRTALITQIQAAHEELRGIEHKLQVLVPAREVLTGNIPPPVVRRRGRGRPRATGIPVNPSVYYSLNKAALARMPLIDALRSMAQATNGEVATADTGQFLIDIGLSRKKHAWQASAEAYAALYAARDFEKTGAGRFKLIDKENPDGN